MENNNNVILSIGILVSKGVDEVKRCLDSLAPIREALPCQLILTDTGCGEETRRILEEYADTLTEFTWCNDFAAARNANLSAAVGEWYMFMDDDEWFVRTDDLIEFFALGKYKEYDRAYYTIRDYQAADGSMYSESSIPRAAARTEDTHFEGRVHEYLAPAPTKGYVLLSCAEHCGYVFETEEERNAHFERNYSIMKELMEEEPQNLHWQAQMAQEYLSVRRFDELESLAEKGLQLTEGRTDGEARDCRGTFQISRIVVCEGRGETKKEYERCLEILKDQGITPLCRAFVHWWKAQCAYKMGEFSEAEQDVLSYFETYRKLEENHFELVRQQMALIAGQCFDLEKQRDAWGILISAGLKQMDAGYLREHLDELQLEQKNINLDERVLEAFITSFGVINERALFVRTIKQLYANSDLWERFCRDFLCILNKGLMGAQNVIDICEEAGAGGSMSYLLEWNEQEKSLISYAGAIHIDDSYPDYRQRFDKLYRAIIGFYEDLYGTNFRDRTELPPHCLAALILEEGFACENDRERFVEVIKQCAVLYPEMGQAVKRLLTLFLTEPERKEREAKKELRRLRNKLLGQSKNLMAVGHPDQAYAILQQLKTIVPDDLEIMSLSLKAQIAMAEIAMKDSE